MNFVGDLGFVPRNPRHSRRRDPRLGFDSRLRQSEDIVRRADLETERKAQVQMLMQQLLVSCQDGDAEGVAPRRIAALLRELHKHAATTPVKAVTILPETIARELTCDTTTNLDGECVICLDAQIDGEAVATLTCGHGFHAKCLSIYWSGTAPVFRCCLCRKNYDQYGQEAIDLNEK